MSLFDQELINRLNAVISASIGIHYAPDRLADLEKAIELAAQDLNFSDAQQLALKLFQGTPNAEEVQAIARHLTIAETYFFREPRAFDELEAVLPSLIEMRRGQGKKLRVLSAGCCTGEEAYSLAMLLTGLIPDIEDWQINIIGGDINQDYLAKAKLGVYTPWAFRGVMSEPADRLKARFFRALENGNFEIVDRLKKMVQFVYLNLADDFQAYERQLGNQPFDLILCRNVLIYFDKTMIKPALQRLSRLLTPGGWLLLAATEVPSAGEKEIAQNLKARLHNDVYLFQREGAKSTAAIYVVPSLKNELEYGRKLLKQGEYAASEKVLSSGLQQLNRLGQERRKLDISLQKQFLELLVRSLSNLGRFEDAAAQAALLVQIDDRYDYLYLCAVVLSESGRSDEARLMLKKALAAKPDFAAASFMLASIALHQGDNLTARQYLQMVSEVLQKLPPESLVECTDGTSVKELLNIVEQLRSGAK